MEEEMEVKPISVRVPKVVRKYVIALRDQEHGWHHVWWKAMTLYRAVAESRVRKCQLFFAPSGSPPTDRIGWIATLTVSFNSKTFHEQAAELEKDEVDAFKFGTKKDFPAEEYKQAIALMSTLRHLHGKMPDEYKVRQSALYMLYQVGERERQGLSLFREEPDGKAIARFDPQDGRFREDQQPNGMAVPQGFPEVAGASIQPRAVALDFGRTNTTLVLVPRPALPRLATRLAKGSGGSFAAAVDRCFLKENIEDLEEEYEKFGLEPV